MYILDTNVLSALLLPERAPQVAAWLGARRDDALYLSVITLGEIERSIRREQHSNPSFAADLQVWADRTTQLFSDRLLPFGAQEARIWGRLSAELGRSDADLLIAATALARDATVVTRNVTDFRPTGARVENPFDL